ncbi:MAG: antibiotic biosynthesis monooxygenase [Bacteroidetes bacterium]|nr:antibiotic biosynthesis monooxygenase [Bacteroidota bacterium]
MKLSITAITILSFLCSCSPTEKHTEVGSWSVIWQYKIKPEHRDEFEREYGPQGSWAALFSRSKDYTGSYLHLSEEVPDTYLLIDTWNSKTAYEAFKKTFAEDYDSLSRRFEPFYETEDRIGTFTRVE